MMKKADHLCEHLEQIDNTLHEIAKFLQVMAEKRPVDLERTETIAEFFWQKREDISKKYRRKAREQST